MQFNRSRCKDRRKGSKHLIFLLFSLICLFNLLFINKLYAEEYQVSNFDEFSAAIAATPKEGTSTLILTEDFEYEKTSYLSDKKTIHLKAQKPITIKPSASMFKDPVWNKQTDKSLSSFIAVNVASLIIDPDSAPIVLDLSPTAELKDKTIIYEASAFSMGTTQSVAKLSNITISGARGSFSSYLIRVSGGAKLNLLEGCIIENNIFDLKVNPAKEGNFSCIISVSGLDSQLTIDGAQIRNNQAAGPMIASRHTLQPREEKRSKASVIELKSGSLSSNKNIANVSPNSFYSGGAIGICGPGAFYMSGGLISENEALMGGGVSISNWNIEYFDGITSSRTYKQTPEQLAICGIMKMTGGEISNNHAKIDTWAVNTTGSGGGIYVDSTNVDLQAGLIANNKADNMGGGIYVSIVPQHLQIKDAAIAYNKATTSSSIYQYPGGAGGGIWQCPAGTCSVYAHEAGIIGKNEAHNGKDVFVHPRSNRYRLDNKRIDSSFSSFVDGIDDYGSRGVASFSGRSHAALEFNRAMSDEEFAKAVDAAPLKILSNEAQKGGGIGSNAYLEIGEEPQTIDIPIYKNWSDGSNLGAADFIEEQNNSRPESLIFDLYLDGQLYQSIEVYKKDQYKGRFTKIPLYRIDPLSKEKHYFTREIKERSVDSYQSKIELKGSDAQIEIQRVFSKQSIHSYPYDDLGIFEAWTNGSFSYDKGISIIPIVEGKRLSPILLDPSRGFKARLPIKLNAKGDKPGEPSTVNLRIEKYSLEPKEGERIDFSHMRNSFEVYLDKDDQNSQEDSWVLKLPKLWLEDFVNDGAGFNAQLIPANSQLAYYAFNYKEGKIKLKKAWDESMKELGDEALPQSLNFKVLVDGKDYIPDGSDQALHIELKKENNWEAELSIPYEDLYGHSWSLEELVPSNQDRQAAFSPSYTFSGKSAHILVRKLKSYTQQDRYKDGKRNLRLLLNGKELSDAQGRPYQIISEDQSIEAFTPGAQPLEKNEQAKPILSELSRLPIDLGFHEIKLSYRKQAATEGSDESFWPMEAESYDFNLVGSKEEGWTLEIPDLGYDSQVSGFGFKAEAVYEGDFSIDTTNHLNYTSLELDKSWFDDKDAPLNSLPDGSKLPAITVQLLQNGKAYGDPIILDGVVDDKEKQAWKYTWDKLPLWTRDAQAASYSIAELELPEDYISSQERSLDADKGIVIRLKNSLKPTTPPPDTPPEPNIPPETPPETPPTPPGTPPHEPPTPPTPPRPVIPKTGDASAQNLMLTTSLIVGAALSLYMGARLYRKHD